MVSTVVTGTKVDECVQATHKLVSACFKTSVALAHERF